MKILGLDHFQLAMLAGQESKADWFYAQVLVLAEVKNPKRCANGRCH